MRPWIAFVALIVISALPVRALDLPAGARLRADDTQDAARASLAIARHNGDTVPSIWAEGRITRQAWKVNGTSRTSFQILTSLRDQLLLEGFEVLLQCQSVSCGGYDFRFAVGHFKAPDMFVDLGDYHYLSARKGDRFISLLVSHSKDAAFIEVMQVDPVDSETSPIAPPENAVPYSDPATPSGPVGALLEQNGRAVLNGLSFATGSSELATEDVPALTELASYLNENPDRKVFLVGHTDAEGSLDGNVALSRKRAAAVMNSLVQLYDVDPDQISAEGVGFLMPLAPNLTPEGREMNRRVEAVLISTD